MTASPGTVFKISLKNGCCYAQLRACHTAYGDILGVDTRLYASPVDTLGLLNTTQIVIFPLQSAIKSGTLSAEPVGTQDIVGSPIPEFKFAVRDNTGAPIYWWIWTGQEIRLADQDTLLEDLPDRAICTLPQFLQTWA